MNLEQAIAYLDSVRSAKFTAADRATIRRVVEDLGAVEFEGRQDHDFFSDIDDIVHVHPTMIVTSREVTGSSYQGTYAQWPYRIELSRWADKGTAAAQATSAPPMCQTCFNPLDERHDDGCY